MKLPIKKKYFDKIKSGEKIFEWRDAHITFVCEETGETLRRWVSDVRLWPTAKLTQDLCESGCFHDEVVIGFKICEEYPIYNKTLGDEEWGDDEIFDDCIFWKKDGCHVHDPNREPLENPRCIYCEYYEPEGGFE